jgi:glycine/D-amino acid oxidase-like deaminating enzyme
VLVERSQLTSGSTFHSAGLVGQLRQSLTLTRMMMNSVDLYRTLGEEVDLETGWREVGSLRLASSRSAWRSSQRQADWAETFGCRCTSSRPTRPSPLPADVDRRRLRRGLLPTDGYVDPSQLTLALAKGARQRGATILTTRA